MEWKNAVAICLISLFSATLVVLIARSLDLQAAGRLEPQLARIVEELEALRKQGGIAAAGSTADAAAPLSNGLVVYYVHGNTRCPTCRSIESQAYDVVQSDFAAELKSGAIVWRVLNYEESSSAELAKKFEIQVPVVVLARMQAGKIAQWRRLDRVWALVGDQPACAAYLRDEIRQLAGAADLPPAPTSSEEAAAGNDAQTATTQAAELTTSPPADLPIPE